MRRTSTIWIGLHHNMKVPEQLNARLAVSELSRQKGNIMIDRRSVIDKSGENNEIY